MQLSKAHVAHAAAEPHGTSGAVGHDSGPALPKPQRQPATEAEQLPGMESNVNGTGSEANDAPETQLAGTSGHAVESTAIGAAPAQDRAATAAQHLLERSSADPAIPSGGHAAAGDSGLSAVSLQHGAERGCSISAGMPATTGSADDDGALRSMPGAEAAARSGDPAGGALRPLPVLPRSVMLSHFVNP